MYRNILIERLAIASLLEEKELEDYLIINALEGIFYPSDSYLRAHQEFLEDEMKDLKKMSDEELQDLYDANLEIYYIGIELEQLLESRDD